ncbi:hypothetical protein GGR57DRAFT_43889 [Xylariaceae sp. FL1272]|nr:hypothetical protein GGR57DRAFT_43889 [Xylariaceae sp. FL1272]
MSDGLISPLDITGADIEYDVLGANLQMIWASGSFDNKHYMYDALALDRLDCPSRRNEYYQCPTPDTATHPAAAYPHTPPQGAAYEPTTPESPVCISPCELQLANAIGANIGAHQHLPMEPLPLNSFPLPRVISPLSPGNTGFPFPTSPSTEVLTSPNSSNADVPTTNESAAAHDAQKFLRKKRRSNRLAVAKSRQKKSDEEEEMKERERSLCAENKSLKDHQRLLRDKVIELKTQILSHHGCCDASINAYIQSCAHVLSLPLPS